MNIKYLLLAAISGTLVALDQVTKMYIHTTFQLGDSIEVIPGFFNITHVHNYGAAFGIFGASHPGFREIFFLAISPIALLIILAILRGVDVKEKAMTIALSLVFGGAIGNYIDRLRFRYVIDFLDFHIQNKYVWPAFNVADSAIVTGVALLIYLEMVKSKQKQQAPQRA